MKVVINNDWASVKPKIDDALDKAMQLMASDIERLAKQKVPVNKGYLLSQGRSTRVDKFKYTIEFNTDYAFYQEFGAREDGSHQVKNYTKSGTGKNYLRGSVETITKNATAYIKTAARIVGS